MANGQGYFKQLKELVASYTDNGVIQDIPTGIIARKELPTDIQQFLKQFVDLLLNSRILCRESKEYIKNPYITQKGIAEELRRKTGENFNEHTIQTKLWHDKNKLYKYFSERMLLDLIEYRDESKLKMYEEALTSAWNKYSNDKILNSIALELPETSNSGGKNIEQVDFEDFIATILPYTKRHMKVISENLSVDTVAYCKRLLSATELDSKDLENKNTLLDLLSDQ